MKTLEEIKRLIKQNEESLRLQYGVKKIGIFGSFVKGAQKIGSDLDILIEFEKPVGFVKFMRLENKLSELAGVKVELVTKNALKPHIGQHILQEVIYV